jgi:flagellar L-ring protein precursor FlgH
MYRKLLSVIIPLAGATLLTGCVSKPPKPNEEAFIPPRAIPVKIVEKNTYASIFNQSTIVDLYGDKRAHRVGDIITVRLDEKTASSKSNSTALDKSNATGVDGGTWFGTDSKVLGVPMEANINSSNSFSGSGSSAMKNSLQGSITVVVHEVRPNGILYIQGEKWLTLNQGDEYIRISGLIRESDVDSSNVVSSVKIADARIKYSGRGALQDTNSIGWAAKFFISSLFPF